MASSISPSCERRAISTSKPFTPSSKPFSHCTRFAFPLTHCVAFCGCDITKYDAGDKISSTSKRGSESSDGTHPKPGPRGRIAEHRRRNSGKGGRRDGAWWLEGENRPIVRGVISAVEHQKQRKNLPQYPTTCLSGGSKTPDPAALRTPSPPCPPPPLPILHISAPNRASFTALPPGKIPRRPYTESAAAVPSQHFYIAPLQRDTRGHHPPGAALPDRCQPHMLLRARRSNAYIRLPIAIDDRLNAVDKSAFTTTVCARCHLDRRHCAG